MTVLGLLIPVSLLLGLIGAVAFIWAVDRDQFEDVEGAAARMLEDMPPPDEAEEKKGEDRT